MARTHKCSNQGEIDALKGKIDDIHKSIVGNGKPGLNSDMRLVMTEINNHATRLERNESLVNKLDVKMALYAGGIAVIVFFITWIGPAWFGG